jgi:hypothetical protein
MIEGPDPEPDPDPYLSLMDPDPGGPKTCGSYGSGSALLLWTISELSTRAPAKEKNRNTGAKKPET